MQEATDYHATRREQLQQRRKQGMVVRGKALMLTGAAHAGESIIKSTTRNKKRPKHK